MITLDDLKTRFKTVQSEQMQCLMQLKQLEEKSRLLAGRLKELGELIALNTSNEPQVSEEQ